MTVRNEVISVGVCKRCGAEVRAESFYCYNCGGKVEVDDSDTSEAQPIKTGQNGASAEVIDDSILDSTSVPRKGNLRTRRERKRIHVVWEKSDGPGYLILLFAVTIAVIVFVMLAVASYLK